MGMMTAAVLAAAVAQAAYAPPRTPDGRPDLQGYWTNGTLTMLERDDGTFKALVATEAQAAAYEAMMNDPDKASAYGAEQRKKHGRLPAPDVGAQATQQYISLRMLRVRGEVRTSFITDPADGQLPYTKAAAARSRAAWKGFARVFDNPEDRDSVERCLIGPAGGPPLSNYFDLSNYTIVQTPQDVALVMEGNHDVRHVRMGGEHRPAAAAGWMGDSVAEWQGDVLRVETRDFPAQYGRGIGLDFMLSPKAQVTEWFARTGPDEITYRFQVDDPDTYTRAWRGEMVLTRLAAPVAEFACHEGNYSMAGILGGARRAESEGRTPEPLDGGDPPPKADAAPAAGVKPPA